MTLEPAPANHGIKFKRVDLGEDAVIDALVDYVTTTARGTTLEKGDVKISTLEHLMATFSGLGIDNALVNIDAQEVPILDGSAKPYIDAMWADGFEQQDAPRSFIELKDVVEMRNDETGSVVRIEPADEFSYDITVDFNSRVLGVQHATWDPSVVYAEEVGVCRTFVFFHEIEFLFKN